MISYKQRIALTLPPWWGDVHSVLDSVVAGYAAAHQTVDTMTASLVPLMRVNTATGDILDIACADFFGANLSRNISENDDVFRARLQANLFVTQGVRSVFVKMITALVGFSPVVIDLRQPADTGVMGNVNDSRVPTLFYNSAAYDCYTNLTMPYQWFVRIVATNASISLDALRGRITQAMPAGTVCWLAYS